MSITSLLNGKEEKDIQFQEILRSVTPKKSEFYTLSGDDPFSKDYKILAPNNLTNVYYSSVVGTAFDYIARFIVARKIKVGKESSYSSLVAERGLTYLKMSQNEELFKIIEKKYYDSIAKIINYVNGKSNTNEIMKISCFLARLEHIARSRMMPVEIENLKNNEEKEVINDLNNIVGVFLDKFMPLVNENSEVFFNPHFGRTSTLCGGADADIFIDGVLYEFKTNKNVGYNWKEVAQVISYFYLKEIEEEENFYDSLFIESEIIKLSFYRARFGQFENIDISKLRDSKFSKTKDELFDLIYSGR